MIQYLNFILFLLYITYFEKKIGLRGSKNLTRKFPSQEIKNMSRITNSETNKCFGMDISVEFPQNVFMLALSGEDIL